MGLLVTKKDIKINSLSMKCLELMARGCNKNKIAEEMAISLDAVERMINRLKSRLGARTEYEILRIASQHELLVDIFE